MYFVSKVGCLINLEEGQHPVNVSLIIQEVVITDSKVYHTGVKEGTAFLTTAIKFC